MDAEELLPYVDDDRLTTRLMYREAADTDTELLHGDKTSIQMIFHNLTGRNFGDDKTAHENYLAWAEKQLSITSLDAKKIFVHVR